MKLIIGLGNPGEKYQNNRHNVGFMFLDYLLKNQRSNIKDLPAGRQGQNDNSKFKYDKYLLSDIYHLSSDIILAKPQTFMNNSGLAVNKLIKKFIPHFAGEDLVVIHDDLDVPLGKFHIQKTGPKLHNGIESIEKTLGAKDFLRVRIGVDNRDPDKRIDGETYVLQNFLAEEKIIINHVFKQIYLWIRRYMTSYS